MPYLAVRDPFADAKTTLSSWDNCMAKSYCKWPVIVAIIVGSLIILSVVFCVARCVCCGAELACCCCSCLKCCCPSGGGGRGHKRVKSDTGPPPTYPTPYQAPIAPPPIDTRPLNQQYRSHAAPSFDSAPERPQFATFESPSKPTNEDALPAMPSWSEAKSTHVEEMVMPEKRDDVEMANLNHLNHNGSVTDTSVSGGTGVAAARRSPGPSPIQRTPTDVSDPYGFPPGYQNDSFASNAPRRSPGPGARYAQQEGYRGMSPVAQQNLSPVYGAAGGAYARNQQHGRRSPNQPYNQHFDQAGPRRSPQPPSPGAYGGYAGSNSNLLQNYDDHPSQQHYADYADAAPQHYETHDPQQHYVEMPSTSGAYNDTYAAPAPAPAPIRQPSPPRAPSAPPARYQSPVAAYPGQQTYDSGAKGAYPGQQTYQAFNPNQSQAQAPERQFSPVQRKPLDGSWKEV